MHLSLSTLNLLLLSPLFQTLGTATPAPAPVPAIFQDSSEGPIKLPNYSSSAAVRGLNGESLIYYQPSDGAIHELRGFNYFFSGFDKFQTDTFRDTIVLSADKVRKGSPLAVADLDGNFDLRLYYLSPQNQLKELVNINEGGWFDGQLNDGLLNNDPIFVKPDSTILWAVSTQGDLSPFVGYVATDGYLSGAINDGFWRTSRL